MSDRSRPLVTIGIPTYNRADSYLRAAVQSALDQTYPNLEVVISDNGSVDHTEELIRSIADPRIRYFKQEQNLGVTGNFNFCVQQARGAYFLLLCDDDLIDPDFVETCMDAAGDRTDYGMIRTGMRRIDPEGNVTKERPNLVGGLPTKEFFHAWFRGGQTPMHLCSTLFNREGLLEVGGFESVKHLWCDVVPEVRLAARYERVDIEEVKASFRIHALKNSAAGKVKDWCEDSRYLFDVILEVTEDVDRGFRRVGSHFFARHCLDRARWVASLRERWVAYYIVYRSFDHTTSVFLHAFVTRPTRKLFRRGLRGLRRLRFRLS
jgi:glycosyltransferase involved in cell wall biosynthesis